MTRTAHLLDDATEDNECAVTWEEDRCSPPRSYSEEQLNQAIFDMMKKKVTLYGASYRYGIPITTLRKRLLHERYVQGEELRMYCKITGKHIKLKGTVISCTTKNHGVPEDDLPRQFCDGVSKQKTVDVQTDVLLLVPQKPEEETALCDGTAPSRQLLGSPCSKISSAAEGVPLSSQNACRSKSIYQDNLLLQVPVVICTPIKDLSSCVPTSVKYSSNEAMVIVTKGTEEQFPGAKGQGSVRGIATDPKSSPGASKALLSNKSQFQTGGAKRPSTCTTLSTSSNEEVSAAGSVTTVAGGGIQCSATSSKEQDLPALGSLRPCNGLFEQHINLHILEEFSNSSQRSLQRLGSELFQRSKLPQCYSKRFRNYFFSLIQLNSRISKECDRIVQTLAIGYRHASAAAGKFRVDVHKSAAQEGIEEKDDIDLTPRVTSTAMVNSEPPRSPGPVGNTRRHPGDKSSLSNFSCSTENKISSILLLESTKNSVPSSTNSSRTPREIKTTGRLQRFASPGEGTCRKPFYGNQYCRKARPVKSVEQSPLSKAKQKVEKDEMSIAEACEVYQVSRADLFSAFFHNHWAQYFSRPKNRRYSDEHLLETVDNVLSGKMNRKEAALVSGIDSGTLYMYCKSKNKMEFLRERIRTADVWRPALGEKQIEITFGDSLPCEYELPRNIELAQDDLQFEAAQNDAQSEVLIEIDSQLKIAQADDSQKKVIQGSDSPVGEATGNSSPFEVAQADDSQWEVTTGIFSHVGEASGNYLLFEAAQADDPLWEVIEESDTYLGEATEDDSQFEITQADGSQSEDLTTRSLEINGRRSAYRPQLPTASASPPIMCPDPAEDPLLPDVDQKASLVDEPQQPPSDQQALNHATSSTPPSGRYLSETTAMQITRTVHQDGDDKLSNVSSVKIPPEALIIKTEFMDCDREQFSRAFKTERIPSLILNPSSFKMQTHQGPCADEGLIACSLVTSSNFPTGGDDLISGPWRWDGAEQEYPKAVIPVNAGPPESESMLELRRQRPYWGLTPIGPPPDPALFSALTEPRTDVSSAINLATMLDEKNATGWSHPSVECQSGLDAVSKGARTESDSCPVNGIINLQAKEETVVDIVPDTGQKNNCLFLDTNDGNSNQVCLYSPASDDGLSNSSVLDKMSELDQLDANCVITTAQQLVTTQPSVATPCFRLNGSVDITVVAATVEEEPKTALSLRTHHNNADTDDKSVLKLFSNDISVIFDGVTRRGPSPHPAVPGDCRRVKRRRICDDAVIRSPCRPVTEGWLQQQPNEDSACFSACKGSVTVTSSLERRSLVNKTTESASSSALEKNSDCEGSVTGTSSQKRRSPCSKTTEGPSFSASKNFPAYKESVTGPSSQKRRSSCNKTTESTYSSAAMNFPAYKGSVTGTSSLERRSPCNETTESISSSAPKNFPAFKGSVSGTSLLESRSPCNEITESTSSLAPKNFPACKGSVTGTSSLERRSPCNEPTESTSSSAQKKFPACKGSVTGTSSLERRSPCNEATESTYSLAPMNRESGATSHDCVGANRFSRNQDTLGKSPSSSPRTTFTASSNNVPSSITSKHNPIYPTTHPPPSAQPSFSDHLSPLEAAAQAVLANQVSQEDACAYFGVHRLTLWARLRPVLGSVACPGVAAHTLSREDLDLAVSLVLDHELPETPVAKMFKIPRETLARRCKDLQLHRFKEMTVGDLRQNMETVVPRKTSLVQFVRKGSLCSRASEKITSSRTVCNSGNSSPGGETNPQPLLEPRANVISARGEPTPYRRASTSSGISSPTPQDNHLIPSSGSRGAFFKLLPKTVVFYSPVGTSTELCCGSPSVSVTSLYLEPEERIFSETLDNVPIEPFPDRLEIDLDDLVPSSTTVDVPSDASSALFAPTFRNEQVIASSCAPYVISNVSDCLCSSRDLISSSHTPSNNLAASRKRRSEIEPTESKPRIVSTKVPDGLSSSRDLNSSSHTPSNNLAASRKRRPEIEPPKSKPHIVRNKVSDCLCSYRDHNSPSHTPSNNILASCKHRPAIEPSQSSRNIPSVPVLFGMESDRITNPETVLENTGRFFEVEPGQFTEDVNLSECIIARVKSIAQEAFDSGLFAE